MVIYISTPQQLDNIRRNLTESYELTNDIDMSGFGNWTPIDRFTGNFDGKGYKIKNLSINQSSGYAGLFRFMDSATTVIKNVGIEDCNINSNNYNWTGAVVGTISKGNIENCWSTGTINGQYMIGGIVGQFVTGSVKNCWSTAKVSGLGRVGGLVGYLGSGATVDFSYSTGQVTATSMLGGLIGDNVSTTFTNVTNSYWDITTSGMTISEGGTGKTTSEMKTQSTYKGWDFNSTWGINGDYPYLQVFGVPSLPPKKVTIQLISYIDPIQFDVNKSAKSTKLLQSYSKPFTSDSERYISTIRKILSYVSPIESNVSQSHRSVRTGNRNVSSFIEPIGISVYKESKTIKKLVSFLKPLESHINVLSKMGIIPIYATVSVIENNSTHTQIENNSTYLFAEGGSSNSHRENSSQVSYIENPSYSEVI